MVLSWQWKQWSLWAAVLLVLDSPWFVLGLLIFSPAFCCAKGNQHNPEGKLLHK